MPMKIMVVDDEQPILTLIKTSIENDGYEVMAMSDSRAAAEILKTEKFDGVFADVRMPDVDGFELTRTVRASQVNAKIPIVLITGMNDVETMRKGFQAGATCFLSKPVGPKELSGLVRAMRGPMLKERRRHARLPFRTIVSFQLEARGGKQFESNTLNIGEGGLFLQPAHGLEVGQQINMEFKMPDGSQIRNARGLVVRKEGDGVGIEFVSLLIESQEAIRNFLISEVAG